MTLAVACRRAGLSILLAAGMLTVTKGAAVGQSDRVERERNDLMRRINRMSKPVAQHRVLDRMAGDWRVQGKVRPTADLPFETVQCKYSGRWILGRRFLEQRLRCVAAGAVLEGRGYLGYDRQAGRYTGIWIDTSDTGITTIQGRMRDPKTMVLTFHHNDVRRRAKTHSTAVISFGASPGFRQVLSSKVPGSGRTVVLSEMTYTR